MQCVKNKVDVLDAFYHLNNIDVGCVTESWCINGETDLLHIADYTVAAYYERRSMTHGGVVILLRDDLSFRSCEKINLLSVESAFECAAVRVTCDSHDIVIVCIYRTRDGSIPLLLSKLEECLAVVTSMRGVNRIMICGDLNIDYLTDGNDKKELVDVLSSFNLYCVFNEPTRVAAHSSTGIDYICTNFNDSLSHREVCHNALSDHSAQLISFPVNKVSNLAPKAYSVCRSLPRRILTVLKTV